MWTGSTIMNRGKLKSLCSGGKKPSFSCILSVVIVNMGLNIYLDITKKFDYQIIMNVKASQLHKVTNMQTFHILVFSFHDKRLP